MIPVNRFYCSVVVGLVVGFSLTSTPVLFAGNPIRSAIEAVSKIGAEGSGNEAAIEAAERLRALPAERMARIFDAMKVESPIAKNWFRGIARDISRRTGGLSDEHLEAYIVDRTRNPDGRALAMDFYHEQNPEAAGKIIDNSLNDPSLLIRELAVDRALQKAMGLIEDGDSESAITSLTQILAAARHPRQLQTVIKRLADLGSDVTMADSLAMMTDWQCMAPFDNTQESGFDTVYPPEVEFLQTSSVDLDSTHPGKDAAIGWQPIASTDTSGFVDLTGPYERVKGAIAYLYLEREISDATKAQVRLTTKNANKVWINGTEVLVNEVYHSGSVLDQYIGTCDLIEGTNRILIKLCQNEQTEPWAQEFQFQCRLTDPTGKPIR